MALRCVVGNCNQPEEKVERYYWGLRSVSLEKIEDHAYLDLCYFHGEVLKSRSIYVPIEGWDRPTD